MGLYAKCGGDGAVFRTVVYEEGLLRNQMMSLEYGLENGGVGFAKAELI